MSMYAVVDPATGETVKEYPTITDDELRDAIARADQAHREWSKAATVADRATFEQQREMVEIGFAIEAGDDDVAAPRLSAVLRDYRARVARLVTWGQEMARPRRRQARTQGA